jgi:hypothetical protein
LAEINMCENVMIIGYDHHNAVKIFPKHLLWALFRTSRFNIFSVYWLNKCLRAVLHKYFFYPRSFPILYNFCLLRSLAKECRKVCTWVEIFTPEKTLFYDTRTQCGFFFVSLKMKSF